MSDQSESTSEEKPKRSQGRPVEKPMPPPIPDTPENIAKAIMQGPPKKEWRYLKNGASRQGSRP